jgi:hypothetical protein
MNIDLIQNLFHVLQLSSSDHLFKSLSLTLPVFQREDFKKYSVLLEYNAASGGK